MNDTVLTVLAQVAEQLGFLTPTGPGPEPGPGWACVSVAYRGPSNGRVLVAASPELAQALARNLLALDAAAPVAPDDAMDALRELANVAAGNLLPALLGDGEYHLDAPEPAVWREGLADTASIDLAEGLLAAGVEPA